MGKNERTTPSSARSDRRGTLLGETAVRAIVRRACAGNAGLDEALVYDACRRVRLHAVELVGSRFVVEDGSGSSGAHVEVLAALLEAAARSEQTKDERRLAALTAAYVVRSSRDALWPPKERRRLQLRALARGGKQSVEAPSNAVTIVSSLAQTLDDDDRALMLCGEAHALAARIRRDIVGAAASTPQGPIAVPVVPDRQDPVVFHVGKGKNATRLRLASKDDPRKLSHEGELLVVLLHHRETPVNVQAVMGVWKGEHMNEPKKQIPATFQRLARKLKDAAGGADVLESGDLGYQWVRTR